MYQEYGAYGKPEVLAAKVAPLLVSWGSTGTGTYHFHEDGFWLKGLLEDHFPGEWVMSMLTGVRKLGGTLSYHRDDFEPGLTRRHLVLQSNPRAWVFHGAMFQQLKVGGIYTMDPTEFHASVNWGDTDRIHLVVDVRN